MSRFVFSVMSVLAVVVMASVFTVSTVQQASAKSKLVKVCKKRIGAVSKWRKYQYSARAESRLRWNNKARKKFGARYASWKLARGHYKNCWRNKKMTKWRCVRRARPCTWKVNRGSH